MDSTEWAQFSEYKARAEAAESSLAAMRQRAEEAEARLDGALSGSRLRQTRLSAAIARAERAEEALRHLINKSNRVTSAWRHHGEIPPEDIHALYDVQCAAEVVESSPPADASKMGGDHSEDNLKMVGKRERRLEELVKEAFPQGFDAKDSEVSAPTSEASYSELAEEAWEQSEARAALAEMEQKS